MKIYDQVTTILPQEAKINIFETYGVKCNLFASPFIKDATTSYYYYYYSSRMLLLLTTIITDYQG